MNQGNPQNTYHVALTPDYIFNEDEYAELNAWLDEQGGDYDHAYESQTDTNHFWFRDVVSAVAFKLTWCDL